MRVEWTPDWDPDTEQARGCQELCEITGSFSCCQSCHEDEGMGIPLPEARVNGQIFRLCCEAYRILDHLVILRDLTRDKSSHTRTQQHQDPSHSTNTPQGRERKGGL